MPLAHTPTLTGADGTPLPWEELIEAPEGAAKAPTIEPPTAEDALLLARGGATRGDQSRAETEQILTDRHNVPRDVARAAAARAYGEISGPPPKPDRRAQTSPDNGRKGGRPPAPPHALAADALYEEEYNNERLRSWRSRWFVYTDVQGWTELPERAVEDIAITYFRGSNRFRKHSSPAYIKGAVTHLRALDLGGVPYRADMPALLIRRAGHTDADPAPNLVAFNGQIVNVWDYAEHLAGKRDAPPIVAATSSFFSLDYLQYEFRPDAECPRFHVFLDRVLPDPQAQAQLCRFFGLALADTCRYESFAYLYGPTARNGKSTALQVLQSMVGRHNVAHVDVSTICDRFAAWPLADCKINICGDMRTEARYGELAKIEGTFKDFVSGGALEYEQKGKDKYASRCRARFLFAGNDLPSFVDKSDALWERIRIIHFPVHIPADERDPYLADKIVRDELPGVLQWALSGLADIIQQDRVPETTEGQRIKDEHRLRCDHERLFVAENGYGPGKDNIPARQLYDEYRAWMTGNNYRSLSAGNFYKRIQSLIATASYGSARDGDGGYYKAIRGVEKRFVTDVTAPLIGVWET